VPFALVKAGILASSTTSATPAFGQATASGNLLLAWISNASVDAITSTATGWASLGGGSLAGIGVDIWFKANSGASESNPTFSTASGVAISAVVAEFSGGDPFAPQDRTGGSGIISASPAVVSNDIGDVATGELFVTCIGWALSKAATVTTADTYNNGATATSVGNNDATSSAQHFRMSWGITTSNSVADQVTETNSSMSISNGIGLVASWKLAAPRTAAPQRATVIGQAVQRASLWCKGERIWTPNRRIFVPA
jgi:hypothetical protein